MREKPSSREAYVHHHSHTTRWNDNDVYGHLNNVVHYQLFDSTVNSWLIANRLLSDELVGLVVQSGCTYHAELAFPGNINAGLRVARIGRTSVRYEVGLFAEKSDTAAAEGFFIHVYVNPGTRMPIELSARLRAELSDLLPRQP